jgi:hypothetical protein
VIVSLQVDAGFISDSDTIISDYEREVQTLCQLKPAAREKRATAAESI